MGRAFKCDRCERLYESNTGNLTYTIRKYGDGMDLCDDCLAQIIYFLEHQHCAIVPKEEVKTNG